MKRIISQALLVLGSICLALVTFQYLTSWLDSKNISFQFKNKGLDSMQTIVLVDGRKYNSKLFEKSVQRFLEQGSTNYFDKKTSLLAVITSPLTENAQARLEALEKKYHPMLCLQSISQLLEKEGLDEIPDFLKNAPYSTMTADLLKFWLIDSNSPMTVVTTARLFPSFSKPKIVNDYLMNIINKILSKKNGFLMSPFYKPYSDINSSEIAFIDKDFLIRVLNTQNMKFVQQQCLSRLKKSRIILEKHQNILSEKNISDYERAVLECLQAYEENSSLYIGSTALQSWSTGAVFISDMVILEKNIIPFYHFEAENPAPEERLIYQGFWSAEVAKRYLKKNDINALIASCLIAQDYSYLIETDKNHPMLQEVEMLLRKYQSQLSEKEIKIFRDICYREINDSMKKTLDEALALT